MVGITSIGAYIPHYRLSREEIAKMWQSRGASGYKSVAGYDEDSITMAVAAGFDCMKRTENQVNGLYFATTSAPYKEKQNAAVIAAAVDLDRKCHTADFSNSLRGGAIAMKSAVHAVKSGSAEDILVIASDCRTGAPKGRLEGFLGDGASALMIGSKNVIASIEGSHSVFSDFTDLWRKEADTFIQSGESRFIGEMGFLPLMEETISGLFEKYSLSAADFSKFVFYAQDDREHANLAKRLHLDKSRVQDHLYGQIGNTGTAAALLMLVTVLEESSPGDRILFAGYGDGCDAFVLRATDGISEIGNRPKTKDRIAQNVPVSYGSYLDWRELVEVESSTLPERSMPSLQARWRERMGITAMYGVKCRKCGNPQIHPIGQNVRVCVSCQSKDDFEKYRFSDKSAKLFTYAVDLLQPTKNPPGINGVVDFDGGGRLMMELTDCEPDRITIGMPLEMTLRRFQAKGIVNYFWKAKPIRY